MTPEEQVLRAAEAEALELIVEYHKAHKQLELAPDAGDIVSAWHRKAAKIRTAMAHKRIMEFADHLESE